MFAYRASPGFKAADFVSLVDESAILNLVVAFLVSKFAFHKVCLVLQPFVLAENGLAFQAGALLVHVLELRIGVKQCRAGLI